MDAIVPAATKVYFRPIYTLQCAIALIAGAIILWSIIDYPLNQVTLMTSVGLYALLLVRYPSCWLIVIPVLVPVLDLSPVSGRVFFGEIDVFILTTVVATLLRPEPWVVEINFSIPVWLIIVILIIWQSYTTLIGLTPFPEIDANSFTSYYSQFNALRIARGFIGALLLLPAVGQMLYRQEPLAKTLTYGMLASLTAGVLVVMWERQLFTGLWNFATPYRVTGLFSIMATGGAPIDAHLVLTLPFVYWLYRQGNVKFAAVGTTLLILALYCVAVTYSRANYPALLLSAMTGTGIWHYWNRLKVLPAPQRTRRQFLMTGTAIVLVLIPLASGQYIQSRFSTTFKDLQSRVAHWKWSTEIMSDSTATFWFGMGKGSFPRTYQHNRPSGDTASTASIITDQDNHYLEMGRSHSSGDLLLRQRFDVQEPGHYRISIDLKPLSARPTRLLMEVCERIIFQTYRECSWSGINTAAGPDSWETYNVGIAVNGLGQQTIFGSRPVEIAILNRGIIDGISIDNVQLFSPSGAQLLKNSNFEKGMDHWFLYSGDHLSWHIKNVWVDAFFEGGITGLLVLLLLSVTVGFRLYQRVVEGDELAIPLAAAFAGLFVVGAFDSVFDSPRIGFLVYLLVWIVLSRDNMAKLKAGDSPMLGASPCH